MASSSDAWYVRLPDGRVLRASSTRAVRHHLERGRIPLDCRVRRSAEEEWAELAWTQEFAELVQQRRAEAAAAAEPSSLDQPVVLPSPRMEMATIASRLDPLQLQTVGVRGYVEDLVAALDSTLVRSKLRIAILAGFLAAFLTVLLSQADNLGRQLEVALGIPAAWGLIGAFVLAAVAGASVCDCLITQMTYVELCKLRPARWREARVRLAWNVLHLTLSTVLLVGCTLAAIYGLRHLPAWLLTSSTWPADPAARESLAGAAAAFSVIAEVVLWLILVLSMLLAPLVVVEECHFLAALFHWGRLIFRHLSRALLYEVLALIPAVVMTAALLVPVEMAAAGQVDDLEAFAPERGQLVQIKTATIDGFKLNWILPMQRIAQGLIVAPALAFLVVANVFIYLNLRYEPEPRRKNAGA